MAMVNPAQKPVRVTSTPAIKNAPLVGLAEGNGSFNNYVLAGLVLGVPYYVKKWIPVVRCGGFYTYWLMVVLLGVPITVGYWTVMSTYGRRKNEKVQLPGHDIEHYIAIKDPELKIHYGGKEKIPIQVFHDAYFDGKVDFKGMSISCFLLLQKLISHLCRRRPRYLGATSRLGNVQLHARAFQICLYSVPSGGHHAHAEPG